MQYEQYEQEVKNLQRLIEEAHRIIQDRPVSTSNIQELQAQIQHHEVRMSSYHISWFDSFYTEFSSFSYWNYWVQLQGKLFLAKWTSLLNLL